VAAKMSPYWKRDGEFYEHLSGCRIACDELDGKDEVSALMRQISALEGHAAFLRGYSMGLEIRAKVPMAERLGGMEEKRDGG